MNYSDMKNVDGLLRVNLCEVERQEPAEVDDTVRHALNDIASQATELLNGTTTVPSLLTRSDYNYAAEILTIRDLLQETIDLANRRQREIIYMMH